MQSKRSFRLKVAGLAMAALLGGSVGAFVANVLPGNSGVSERGMAAWSERLTRQYEAYRQARADDAYSDRLTKLAMARVWQAYGDRLNGLADEVRADRMASRVSQAWTDRLNGLADEHPGNQ